MKKLFVGNTDVSLSIAAKNYSPSAEFIEQANLNNIKNIDVGYISIGDHSIESFATVLALAEELYYVPSSSWDSSTKFQTEFWLKYFSHRKPVHNFTPTHVNSDMLELVDQRKTDDQQLWVAGDSFTVGTPWVELDETYRQILSNRLELPVSVLAKGGSSISWAVDQILRSDVRAGDIVVLMLTSIHRFPYYDGKLNHIFGRSWELNPKLNKIINQNILVLPHLLYIACRSISQLVLDSQKVGYRLVITKTPLDDTEPEFAMLDFLSGFSCFAHNYYDSDAKLIDYGNDNDHPGPLQHQHYANIILEHLNNENLS
jgi:hypothetical protein